MGENESKESKEIDPSSLEGFIADLTRYQPQLHGFIAASIGNPTASLDILQNTNLSLWAKSQKYDSSKPFLPWALTFARYEVLAFCRDRGRDRHAFNSDVVEQMFHTAGELVNEIPDRQLALRKCLELLSAEHRYLLTLKYTNKMPLVQISGLLETTVAGVKCKLSRVRRKLGDCVTRRLAAQNRT